jgi:RNA polymerase sigma factor (sigma-70 family)
MNASPSVAEQLAQHSQALRTLARDLVGAAHADDLVQDTAVRALRSPPARAAGLLAWLATVMRNLAANHRRTERRRARREAAGARGGDIAAPAADAELAQRDAVRAVTDALWRLPEPYQHVLVARYFRGESPAAIAARTGTPLATIKSRLQRGLDQLRASLAQRDGRDWRLAVLPAFGLPRAAAVLPLFPVLVMTTFGKLAVGGTAATAALLLAWWLLVGAPPAPPALASGDATAPAGAAVARSALPAEPPSREAAGERPAGTAVAGTGQPFAFTLHARVVDANGAPVGGVHLVLAPPSCALALSAQQTDAGGRIEVAWHARVPSLAMAVGIACQGVHTSLQQVRVEAGVRSELRFVFGAAPLPVTVRLDEHGAQQVLLPDCMQKPERADCRTCHERLPMARLFEVRGSLRDGLHPGTLFGDRLAIAPPNPKPSWFESMEWKSSVGLGGGAASSFRPPRRALSGRVFTADGRPAGGVLVQLSRPDGNAFGTHTRADGSWQGPALAGAGPVTLRAGGGAEGRASRELDVVDGQPVFVDLVLTTGRTLRGRVLGEGGAPVAGTRVEYLAPAGEDPDLATTAPDGTFAFANLPPGPARVLLWGARGERFPLADEPVVPDGPEVVLDLRTRAGTNGALRVDVRGDDGERPPDAFVEVRAWQQATGRGAALTRLGDGAFHAHGLAAGFYRVEAGALASGWRDFGTCWVDGAGVTDLGPVRLPPAARLRVVADADLDGLELCLLRDDAVVRAEAVAPWTRELQLPPGRWLALWKHADAVVGRELALAAGAETVLDAR